MTKRSPFPGMDPWLEPRWGDVHLGLCAVGFWLLVIAFPPVPSARMYQLHLIRKYLLNRRIAWVALVAVMLCTAMVLVVISVMGGWLKTFKESFHGMTGDVVVTTPSLNGFPYYQQMIDGIRNVDGVAAASPVVRTWALLTAGGGPTYVQVIGYRHDIGEVNDWPATLHDQTERKHNFLTEAANPDTTPARRAELTAAADRLPNFDLRDDVTYENHVPERAKTTARNRPGIIVSSILAEIKHTTPADQAAERRRGIQRLNVKLTVLPLADNVQPDAKEARTIPCWIVDDSKSKLWQADSNNIYMSFDKLQANLGMAPDGEPARCSEIEIKVKPGYDNAAVSDRVKAVVKQIRAEFDPFPLQRVSVQTWQEQQGTFIKAVENEVVLTTALFGIISMVAVLLIFCIFYMIVLEKTKDIGILKSVGATSTGILSLFLGYGLAIGVVGAGLGLTIAFLLVRNINEIHDWLALRMGRKIWDPETYQFDKIPSSMDTKTVVWVVTVSVLSALLGAALPALKAATMNPVDSLRYE